MIAGILLAAGESRRMGTNKALLPLGNSTVIEKVIRSHLDAGIDPFIVVLGHEHARVAAAIAHLPVHPTRNENYRDGMFSSAVAGVKAVDAMAAPDGVLFSLVDQPAITTRVIRELATIFREHGDRIVLPEFEGRGGHPILFPWEVAREVLDYTGEGGLRGFRDLHADRVLRVPCNDEAVVRDMDNRKDYSREVSEISRNSTQGDEP